jgi:hypothetical protein
LRQILQIAISRAVSASILRRYVTPAHVLPCHFDVFASHCGTRKKQREAKDSSKGNAMNLILLIVLIVLLLGAAPTWPYSRNWGYYPSGGLGMVVVILLILMLMGRI